MGANSSSILHDENDKYGPYLGWIGGSEKNWGFFCSQEEHDPWIQFQIKQTPIVGILLINRKDNAGEGFRDIKVRAGLKSGIFINPVVGSYKGPGVTKGNYYFDFNPPIDTKYITISKDTSDERAFLHLNGVRVIARGMWLFSFIYDMLNK